MTEIFFRRPVESEMPTIEEHTRAAALEASSYRGSPLPADDVGETIAYVAGIGGVVLGSVVATLKTDGSAHVKRLWVEPDAREVGIGDRLLSGLLDELDRAGCHWVSGTALPGDRQTKNLFERHGLVAQTIVVGRRLNDSSTGEDASR